MKLKRAADEQTCSMVVLSMARSPQSNPWMASLLIEFQECPSRYRQRPPYSPFTDARVAVAPELYGPGYAWSSRRSPTCRQPTLKFQTPMLSHSYCLDDDSWLTGAEVYTVSQDAFIYSNTGVKQAEE